MKLAILGATGQTGKPLVQQALDGGHQVVAIVRSPAKLEDVKHDNLTVVEGNIFSDEDLAKHLVGVDAVLSTLGFSLREKPVTGYTEMTKAVTKAMRTVGCKRLLVMHSWWTKPESRGEGAFWIRWFLIPFIRPVLDNMRQVEEFLESECKEDIDYTVVLPAGLTNNPVTAGDFTVAVDKWSVEGAATRIARADVARYMLKIVNDQESFKKIHAIAV